jgi:hypothetical protein
MERKLSSCRLVHGLSTAGAAACASSPGAEILFKVVAVALRPLRAFFSFSADPIAQAFVKVGRLAAIFVTLLGLGVLHSTADELADCSEDSFDTAIANDGEADFTEDCSIVLTSTFVVEGDVTIDGGGNAVSISATNGIQMFYVTDGSSLTISGVTLTGASISNIVAGGFQLTGAAIFVEPGGTVVLTSCTVAGNTVFGAQGMDGMAGGGGTGKGQSGTRGTTGGAAMGGAIYNLGDLTVDTCTFSTNAAIAGSGGIGGDGGASGGRGGNGGNGGVGGVALGGAIYNAGTSLIITNSSFFGNVAVGGNGGDGGATGSAPFAGTQGDGGVGGIASGGALYSTNAYFDIEASTFVTNVVTGGTSAIGGMTSSGAGHSGKKGGDGIGGGIAFGATNKTEITAGITNCTFYNNTASGGGGGTGGTGSAKGGNGGGGGGGIGGSVAVVSKVTDVVSIINCTFYAGNAVGGTNGPAGAGPFTGHDGSRGSAHGGNLASTLGKKSAAILNDIFDTPFSGGNLYGKIDDLGNNISSDKSFKLDRKKKDNLWPTNAMLEPLANYGGPTLTMALAPISPAIDAGDPDGAPSVDQRGAVRDDAPDIGAYEVGGLVVLSEPEDATVPIGGTNTFSVRASGKGTLSYQWFFDGMEIPGATRNTYTVTNAQPTNAGTYEVTISNGSQSVDSDPATLTVTDAPIILGGPTNIVAATNSTTNFSITVTGRLPMAYQWLFNGTNAPNGAGALDTNTVSGSGPYTISYFITNVQPSNAGTYSIRVTNIEGSATSSNATLSLSSAPVITSQPTNMTVNAGASATFSVTATGSPPLTYQWYYQVNDPITGATNSSYTVTNAQIIANAGTYDVVVGNSFGSVTSSNATLTVNNQSSLLSSIAQPPVVTPPPPPTILVGPAGPAAVSLGFQVKRGLSYIVDSITDLRFGSWMPYSTNNPQTDGTLTVTVPKTNSSSFYRVRVQ